MAESSWLTPTTMCSAWPIPSWRPRPPWALALFVGLVACADPCLEPGNVCTVAGVPGIHGVNGDDLRPLQTWLYFPYGLAAEASGAPLVADFNNMRIRRLEPELLRTLAGDGRHAVAVPGPDARQSPLENPVDVAALPDGRVAIMELHTGRVLACTPGGGLEVLAGTGEIGFSGDGGDALVATFSEAWGLAADPAGNLYVADTDNHRIRIIGADGVVNTLVGDGVPGWVDGLNGRLNAPLRVRYAGQPRPALLVADTGNHAIRRFDLETGELTTLAGTGAPGFGGDGGPAAEASLHTPSSAVIDASGALWIADSGNQRIRVVRDGRIDTAFGDGTADFAGEGAPAASASFRWPADVLPLETADGPALFVADTQNGVVRRISLSADDHGG